MRKESKLIFIAILLLGLSCTSNTKENTPKEQMETKSEEMQSSIKDKTYLVSNTQSIVKWKGKAVGHGHDGTINVVAGKFSFENGNLSEGKVSIDMNSIQARDLEEGSEDKAKLEGHLKHSDFFDVENFPLASLNITDASNLDAVKASLTIKDKTQNIEFPLKLESMEDGTLKIQSSLSFDRTKFGVTYNSGNFYKDLGDRLIEDKVSLSVVLIAK